MWNPFYVLNECLGPALFQRCSCCIFVAVLLVIVIMSVLSRERAGPTCVAHHVMTHSRTHSRTHSLYRGSPFLSSIMIFVNFLPSPINYILVGLACSGILLCLSSCFYCVLAPVESLSEDEAAAEDEEKEPLIGGENV